MTSLRIAFDMDGTIADLSTAFHQIEDRLFGPYEAEHSQPQPEVREEEQEAEQRAAQDSGGTSGISTPIGGIDAAAVARERLAQARAMRRHNDIVWHAIESTPDFWTTLKPLEDGVIRRLWEAADKHRWEVFFITQRPATAGESVQRQTQRWLVEQGFELPSVIPLSGSRGKACQALKVDFLVDDTAKNCVDVISDSSARAVLVTRGIDDFTESGARRLGIVTVKSASDAIDILEQATVAKVNPTFFARFLQKMGIKT
ncbi:MAG: HAD family hydrolase [Acidobacteriota bacterium]|nr:HAD family hydrolase [Acidobacteriota bacterium]